MLHEWEMNVLEVELINVKSPLRDVFAWAWLSLNAVLSILYIGR